MTSLRTFGRPVAALLGAIALTFSPVAFATDQCDFEIEADLTVGPERIVIDDRWLGEVVIGDDGELEIDGEAIDLDDDQREAVEAYADQLRDVIPAVVELALDAMDLGVTAVTDVFAALVDGDPPNGVHEALEDLRADVRERLGRDEEVWYVRGDGISGTDDAMESIEPLVERAVAESIGTLLIAVGQSMRAEDGSLEERMEAFADRMERIEEDIEDRVERDADAIERQADRLCAEMEILASREEDMRDRVPELSRLRVLEQG